MNEQSEHARPPLLPVEVFMAVARNAETHPEAKLIVIYDPDKYVVWWFAEGPLSRENAVDIVQKESLKERLPQSRNYFYIIAEAPDTNRPGNTLDD